MTQHFRHPKQEDTRWLRLIQQFEHSQKDEKEKKEKGNALVKILIAVDEWFIETGTVHKKRDRRFKNSSVDLFTIYIIAIKKYLGNSRITQ